MDKVDVIRAIDDGTCDAVLDAVKRAVERRHEALGVEREMEVQVGDVVAIVETIRPLYLRGMRGVVQGREQDRVVVKMDDTSREFRRAQMARYIWDDGTMRLKGAHFRKV